MFKRTLLLISLFLIAMTIAAQETQTWSAFLFDNVNNDLIRVDADGNTETFPLNIIENEYVSSMDISISHNGRFAAYCKSANTPDTPAMGIKTVVIEEIGKGSILEIPYGGQPACSVTAFSDDDTMIALSIVHYNAFDERPVDATFWSISLLDMMTGEVQYELTDKSDFAPDFVEYGDNIPMLAIVSQFDNQTVNFNGIPYVGRDGGSYLPAYEWDLNENTITQLSKEYGRVGSAFLDTTGELIYPALDESFDAAQPEGPIPQANVVKIINADGTTNTLYQNSEWVIINISFINNGESIAVTLIPGFELAQTLPAPYITRVEIIHRDGTSQLLDTEFDGDVRIKNLPEGAFIAYTPNPSNPDFSPTQFLFWNGNTLNQIGEYLPDYSEGFTPPQLLWVTPSTANADLPSFSPTV